MEVSLHGLGTPSIVEKEFETGWRQARIDRDEFVQDALAYNKGMDGAGNDEVIGRVARRAVVILAGKAMVSDFQERFGVWRAVERDWQRPIARSAWRGRNGPLAQGLQGAERCVHGKQIAAQLRP